MIRANRFARIVLRIARATMILGIVLPHLLVGETLVERQRGDGKRGNGPESSERF